MKKILVSVPHSPYQRIESDLVNWLIKNIVHYNYNEPGRINISYDFVEGKPIDNVRNHAINKFLATDNDYFMALDSVTGDTPIFIRKGKFIDFIEISELVWGSEDRSRTQEVRKDIDVMTHKGWCKINYIKKHKVDKPIYRILINDGYVKVTGDHSLFKKGKAIKGCDINIGDKLDKVDFTDNNKSESMTEEFAEVLGFFVAEGSCDKYKGSMYSWALNNNDIEPLEKYKKVLEAHYCSEFYYIESKHNEGYDSTWELIPKNMKNKVQDFRTWCYTKSGMKKVPKVILNSNKKIMKAFIKGYLKGDGYLNKHKVYLSDSNSYILTAGLVYLYKKLGIEYSISDRKDKLNILGLRQLRSDCERSKRSRKIGVKNITKVEHNDFVYDIGTEHGTFVGGIGNYVYHNSDIIPPDNCIETLLSWNQDIVGATCFSFQYGYPFAVILKKIDGGYTTVDFTKNRLQECDATGASCLLVKRKVITDMKEHLLKETGQTMYFKTLYKENGEISWGQDFMFCEHALQMGYKIYVDTGLLCGHKVDRMDIRRVNDLLIEEKKKGEQLVEEVRKEYKEIKSNNKESIVPENIEIDEFEIAKT